MSGEEEEKEYKIGYYLRVVGKKERTGVVHNWNYLHRGNVGRGFFIYGSGKSETEVIEGDVR